MLQRETQKKTRTDLTRGMKAKAGERVLLTPERAIDLLEHNTINRPLHDGHVHRIARQIADGKWQFNGDTIKVASTGDVLDGQHRLWAVLEAKTPIDTLIVYGIEKEAFSTIDTLRKPRSGADVLALNGATRYRNITASALQWLIRWQRGLLVEWKAPQNRVENSDIEEAYRENPSIENAIEKAMRLRTLANPSILGFLYFIFYNRNEDLADRMMSTLENPGPASINDPFFRLREYFLSDHLKRKEPLHSIALAFKAANAAHVGKDIRSLQWKTQGHGAEGFPVLDIGGKK